MRKLIIIIAILLTAAIAWRLFGPAMGGDHGGFGGPMPVDVAQVIVEPVHATKVFSGRLSATQGADIRPQVAGTIQEVHFQEGQMVKKGDKLFTLDPRPFAAQAAAAAAQASRAQADLNRAKTLREADAISQQEFDRIQEGARTAVAAYKLAQVDVDRAAITSPIDGRVGRVDVTVGNVASPANPTPLTTVQNISPIYADFDLSEQDYLNLLASNGGTLPELTAITVNLALANESSFTREGRLYALDNRVDPQTGAVRARAVFNNTDGSLIPGLFARVELKHPEAVPTVLIADQAVSTDQDRKIVTVVTPDGKPVPTKIVLGQMFGNLRIIESGLKAGDKIVVNGLMRLMPGAPIMPQTVDMRTLKPISSTVPTPAPATAPAPEAPQPEAQPVGQPAEPVSATTTPAVSTTDIPSASANVSQTENQ